MYIYIVYAKYNQASSSNHVEVTALSPVIVICLQWRRHEIFIGGGGVGFIGTQTHPPSKCSFS